MGAELLACDPRSLCQHFETAKPLAADVVVTFVEHQASAVVSVEEVGEVKEEAHVDGLPDRTEPQHQSMIEAREVIVAQRGNDGLRQSDGASLDRIACELSALQKNFREDIERVLDETALLGTKARGDEGMMDLVQGARQLDTSKNPAFSMRRMIAGAEAG